MGVTVTKKYFTSNQSENNNENSMKILNFIQNLTQ